MFEILQEQNQGAALPGNICVVFYSYDASTSRWIFWIPSYLSFRNLSFPWCLHSWFL